MGVGRHFRTPLEANKHLLRRLSELHGRLRQRAEKSPRKPRQTPPAALAAPTACPLPARRASTLAAGADAQNQPRLRRPLERQTRGQNARPGARTSSGWTRRSRCCPYRLPARASSRPARRRVARTAEAQEIEQRLCRGSNKQRQRSTSTRDGRTKLGSPFGALARARAGILGYLCLATARSSR